ncbi:hypothetical protein [Variovorax ginsengisoli]|uniref:Uncharacterized protein n=1 Tax=Variovorax ginsengisoli TaxID=363844 RepID=A0ABT8SBR4_9BURK|nr:hypothetical protein [Variovorax ginsengisoli]MDN8617186.1 hypothetical protein [Variovorax ginsengisoli]MDO1536356.1 hypothetical protein [Variovorax ginsengisoli]
MKATRRGAPSRGDFGVGVPDLIIRLHPVERRALDRAMVEFAPQRVSHLGERAALTVRDSNRELVQDVLDVLLGDGEGCICAMEACTE